MLVVEEGDADRDGDSDGDRANPLWEVMMRSRLQPLSTNTREPLLAAGKGGANARPLAVKAALEPTPSTGGNPAVDPAKNDTSLLATTMRRMRNPALSATNRLPAPSSARYVGPLKSALVPAASTVPAAVPTLEPPPATDDTAPLAVLMTRTRLLPVSATYSALPLLLSAAEVGFLNIAAAPMASAKPAVVALAAPPPARTATVAPRSASSSSPPAPTVTVRMTLRELSTT